MGKVIYNTIMFIINFAFFVAGALVMSFGILLLVDPSVVENGLNHLTGYQNINYIIDLNSAMSASGAILTGIGAVIVCISFIGLMTCCCGGSCLYVIYSIFLGLIIAFEVAVIIVLALNYTNVQNNVKKYMYTALKENFAPVQIVGTAVIPSTNESAAAWEMMQFTYGCCGANGPEDYTSYSSWKNEFNYAAVSDPTFPPSCCIQIVQYQVPNITTQFADLDTCLKASTANPTYVNTKSCSVAVMDVISQYNYITNIIIVSLIALEVIILQLTIHQYYGSKDSQVGGYA